MATRGWPLVEKYVRRRSTLPRSHPRSTIDAEGLSFRVRNGTGRFPFAMAAETLLIFQSEDHQREAGNQSVLDRQSRTTKWTRAPLMWCQIIGLLVPVSFMGL